MILGILQWKSTSFEKKLIKITQKRKKKNSFFSKARERWRNDEWIEFRASDIGHPHQHFLN